MSNKTESDVEELTRVKEFKSAKPDGMFLLGRTYMRDGEWYAVMVPRDPFVMAWPVQCATRKEADQWVKEQLAKH